ncbi:MAG TPA: RNA polymerase sigma factor [Steroidobacteraceae bacterium]|nr:RNA polymerase sigma factor [Steroidobacteraceae bacterium]
MAEKKPGDQADKRAGALRGLSGVFLQHQSSLKRFIARFVSRPQDVEDVTQEAYLRAFDAERSGEHVRSPKAFLFRIAKNVALNELARKSRLLTDYIEDSTSRDVIQEDISAEDRVMGDEKLTMFCRAVVTLPVQCRRAFLLRKVHGLSHREISDRLDISVSTVEKHVASGLLRCSTYMREGGYPVHVAEPADRERGKLRRGE